MAQFLITHPTIEVTSPIITVNIYDFHMCFKKLIKFTLYSDGMHSKFKPDVRSVRISAMNATGYAPTVPLIKTTPVNK